MDRHLFLTSPPPPSSFAPTEWFYLQLSYWYPTLFCAVPRPWGNLPFLPTCATIVACRAPFSTRDLGNTSTLRHSLPWCSPLPFLVRAPSKRACGLTLPVNSLSSVAQFLCLHSVPIHTATKPSHTRWEVSGAFSTVPTVVHHAGLAS